MNKLVFLLTATIISSIAQSQVELGIFAGGQATSARYLVFNQQQKTDNKYGAQAGVTLKVPFDNKLFFAPTLFYSTKGYKVVFTDFVYPPDTAAINNNTTIHTVELGALLHFDLGKNPSHLFIKIGPTLDFHLFGKEKYQLKNGGSVDHNMKFSFDGDYGHIGANLLLQLGYESANGLFIFGHYTHGLASTSNAEGGPNIYQRAYGISIGKYLKRKKIVIDTRNRE